MTSRKTLYLIGLIFISPMLLAALFYQFRFDLAKHTHNRGIWVTEGWEIIPRSPGQAWSLLYKSASEPLPETAQFLLSQIPKTLGEHRQHVISQTWDESVKLRHPPQHEPAPGFYLADPLGRLILFYPEQKQPISLGKDIIYDLKILLKNSNFKENA